MRSERLAMGILAVFIILLLMPNLFSRSPSLNEPTRFASGTTASSVSSLVSIQFKRIVLLYEITIFDVNMDSVGRSLKELGVNFIKATEIESYDEDDTVYITCITHEGRLLNTIS